jgi:hypothetical protein
MRAPLEVVLEAEPEEAVEIPVQGGPALLDLFERDEQADQVSGMPQENEVL